MKPMRGTSVPRSKEIARIKKEIHGQAFVNQDASLPTIDSKVDNWPKCEGCGEKYEFGRRYVWDLGKPWRVFCEQCFREYAEQLLAEKGADSDE